MQIMRTQWICTYFSAKTNPETSVFDCEKTEIDTELKIPQPPNTSTSVTVVIVLTPFLSSILPPLLLTSLSPSLQPSCANPSLQLNPRGLAANQKICIDPLKAPTGHPELQRACCLLHCHNQGARPFQQLLPEQCFSNVTVSCASQSTYRPLQNGLVLQQTE